MTKASFRIKVLRLQRELKMRSYWDNGHTDEEISQNCKVHKDTVKNWRKRENLLPNQVVYARGYKGQMSNRKGLGRNVQL